ncbi:conserved hypothetical protein [Gloeothece citriformis PCC 7424]|uniref:Uncharacterized protein n=1 Tax=Gloeothece citriformis (strain PCC 7424) TaxID=65393 RepID=B7KHX9_GLOC7|nr:hypothetical protein [Gloeothece citriformis]ACK72076.1 conserved hypothetical protein [Gloeothece citriformis PCC 7424]
MKQFIDNQQTEARLQVLMTLAKERYLAAGGDPKRCPSGLKGDDYLTEEERQEAIKLMRESAGVRVVNNEVHCQGRVWQVEVK